MGSGEGCGSGEAVAEVVVAGGRVGVRAGAIVSQEHGGLELAALTDVELLGAVEADGDRLSWLDSSPPANACQGVTEEAIAEMGG